MLFDIRSFALLGCLLPQLCMADTFQIDPRGEARYQQAVSYLQQANSTIQPGGWRRNLSSTWTRIS